MAILKYRLLQKLGASYTFESIDNMDNHDFTLIQACIFAEAHRQNAMHGKHQGADEVVNFSSESDYPGDIDELSD